MHLSPILMTTTVERLGQAADGLLLPPSRRRTHLGNHPTLAGWRGVTGSSLRLFPASCLR